MPQNFIEAHREQGFLLPSDVREWLPEDHLAWFVIEAVADMDLADFYAAYRADGHGRAAYEPSTMVALILYAFATKQRSARAIERHCRQDVAYRVITGNLVPDHATIARFVVRHEDALADLFGDVLSLCAQAGLVKPELIVVDGTRLQGNASPEANREYQRIAREILAEAKATDEAEDELYGEARGDELPEQLRTAEGRRAFLKDAKRKREQEQAAPDPGSEISEMASVVRAAGSQGRAGWLREGRRQLEQHRQAHPQPIPRARAKRPDLAKRRLEEELDTDRLSNAQYEHYRAHARDPQGRGLGMAPKPFQLPAEPAGKVNVTDPDSKQIKTNAGFGWVQGYNAQAVVGQGHVVLAAELTNNTNDWSQLDPMVSATLTELANAGVSERPKVAIADAAYWRESQIDEVVSDRHIAVLIPPDAGNRDGPRPGWTRGRPAWMRHVLSSEPGRELYRKRKQMIEPVFAHKAQPADQTVPPTRAAGGAHRIAITHGDAQPRQAPPPPDSHRSGLNARHEPPPSPTTRRSPPPNRKGKAIPARWPSGLCATASNAWESVDGMASRSRFAEHLTTPLERPSRPRQVCRRRNGPISFVAGMAAPRLPPPGSIRLKLMMRFVAISVWLYRRTGGRVAGKFAGTPVLLLDHVGRKSARRRAVPVCYMLDGADLVIVAARAGSDVDPAWWLNLQAHPHTSVTIGSDRREVIARQATAEEKQALWPRLVELSGDYAVYQKRTERDIPVVILSPATQASPLG